jgi:hypothetical protein
MNIYVSLAITALCRLLVSSQVISDVKERVLRWEQDELTPGKEKQQKVLEDLRVIGIKSATWILTMVIDLVVAQLRIKSGADTTVQGVQK